MDRDEGLKILGLRGWLSQVPPEFRDRFLSMARWRRIEPGALVTLGGEEKDDVIGLAQGTVVLTSALASAETPVMHMAHAVIWLGYGPLLLDQPRRVSVEAKTVAWVAVFPKATVLGMLNEMPHWWRCFMPLLAEYGDMSAIIAADLLIRRSDQRLAATILRFAGLRDPHAEALGPVRVPVTQVELADASNLSRNATGAILRELAAQGFIETDYRGVVVRDPAGLRDFMSRPVGRLV